jgi:hypothetical protein
MLIRQGRGLDSNAKAQPPAVYSDR